MPSASVQPTVVSRPSTGSGQRVADVHEHEAAGAVGVLGHARLEAGLAEQRRLLVAGDAGHRDAGRHAPSRRRSRRSGRSTGAPRAGRDAGTPKRSSSSSDHASVRMSKSIVRLALDGSVACTPPSGPPVRFHSTHESMVPRARSGVDRHAALGEQPLDLGGARSTGRARGRWWRARAARSPPRAARRSGPRCAGPATRWRGAAARPVRRSHATTVSRWSVMPMAAIGSSSRPASSASVAWTAVQISAASCSTQPGLREVLGELAVGEAGRGAVVAHGEGAHAGGAGVDGDDDGHRAENLAPSR